MKIAVIGMDISDSSAGFALPAGAMRSVASTQIMRVSTGDRVGCAVRRPRDERSIRLRQTLNSLPKNDKVHNGIRNMPHPNQMRSNHYSQGRNSE